MNRDLQLVNHLKLQPGDRVVVPKSHWQLIQHHALYLGYDDFGNHYMCENVNGVGVKLTSVSNFFLDVTKVTRIEKFNGTKPVRKVVVEKALSKLGQPYNLINYNCESFVNEVLYKSSYSNQVGNIAGFFALAILIAVIANKS